MEKKIHKIYYGIFHCPVQFTNNPPIRYGWKTLCGEVLWPHWKGSTELKTITCKRCISIGNKQ